MTDIAERSEQGRLPFYETGDQQLDRYQRLDMLPRLEGGFLPTSLAEQTDAVGLIAFADHKAGAAKHLHEVLLHQKAANTSDPLRAVRKKVRNWGGYARDARDATHDLEDLHQELREVDNPELRLDRVVQPTQKGLLPFLRFFDLMELRDTHRPDKIGYDPQKVQYSPENGALTGVFLPMALESWRVHQVRQELPSAIENEAHRSVFWLNRLVEVQRFWTKGVQDVATQELDKYYGRQAS